MYALLAGSDPCEMVGMAAGVSCIAARLVCGGVGLGGSVGVCVWAVFVV